MPKSDIERLREKLEELFAADGTLTEAGIAWFGPDPETIHAVDLVAA